jgi:hypothetical protein
MGKQDVKEYDKSYHPPETIRKGSTAAPLMVSMKNF